MRKTFNAGMGWAVLACIGILGGAIFDFGEALAGPPPHAPAHGYRAKYHYYPSRNVYFQPDRGLYFWWSSGDWQVGVSLPGDLSISLGDHITLDLDTDRPYIFNDDHKAKYGPVKPKHPEKAIPPGQLKKMK